MIEVFNIGGNAYSFDTPSGPVSFDPRNILKFSESDWKSLEARPMLEKLHESGEVFIKYPQKKEDTPPPREPARSEPVEEKEDKEEKPKPKRGKGKPKSYSDPKPDLDPDPDNTEY